MARVSDQAARRIDEAGDGADGQLVARATRELNQSILRGELAPGHKLRVRELRETYGIGGTPIREALWRLTASGLVHSAENRGFRVSPISRDDLRDIIETRSLIESQALRLSMERGDEEWEAGIVSCLHRLKKFVSRGVTAAREGLEEYDVIHKQFHLQIVSACGSPRLLEIHSMLYDQTYRYRSVAISASRPVDSIEREHTRLADLALSRDFEKARVAMERHLQWTLHRFDEAHSKPRNRGKA